MILVIKSFIAWNINQLITYFERVSYLQEYIQYIVEYTYNTRKNLVLNP